VAARPQQVRPQGKGEDEGVEGPGEGGQPQEEAAEAEERRAVGPQAAEQGEGERLQEQQAAAVREEGRALEEEQG
jgi:hypothetical protein